MEEVSLKDEQREQLVLGLAQTIAMQAIELPPSHRPEFIKRAVVAVGQEFVLKYGAAPELAEAIDKLEVLIETMVQIIVETGGQPGRA